MKRNQPSAASSAATAQPGRLARVVGVPGAVLLGLGSIVGTGVFVSIGIAAGVAGPAVIIAVVLAALVATCNGLSSAELAASHPVSGGTYEYGYRYLSPPLGVTAGWMFLAAKSASAATAALGFAGYLLGITGYDGRAARSATALGAVLIITAVVAGGMRRSNRVNAIIVSITLGALLAFVAAGIPTALEHGSVYLASGSASLREVLYATALMFVAYTGYGRIATLSEEVHAPERTIPRAIIVTLLVSMLLYVAVTVVAVASSGAPAVAAATRTTAAPLEVVARGLSVPAVAWMVAAGAVSAMLGVLLNLILGLSRVLLAMARRSDMPGWLACIDERAHTPRRAVMAVGAIIAGLVLLGDVRTTWSFSAFTVLVYYALTNLAALRLPKSARLYPRWIPAMGLLSCLTLAVWVERRVWVAGLGLIAAGLVWHAAGRALARSRG